MNLHGLVPQRRIGVMVCGRRLAAAQYMVRKQGEQFGWHPILDRAHFDAVHAQKTVATHMIIISQCGRAGATDRPRDWTSAVADTVMACVGLSAMLGILKPMPYEDWWQAAELRDHSWEDPPPAIDEQTEGRHAVQAVRRRTPTTSRWCRPVGWNCRRGCLRAGADGRRPPTARELQETLIPYESAGRGCCYSCRSIPAPDPSSSPGNQSRARSGSSRLMLVGAASF